ncbi:MAG TPA: bifunctional folylpolyglutamate synthase/dihydrofolate synthase, partial [Bacillota bacterium]|nr:bifunctional folylpolyglutamate synthase/dihydrofolate synthase [Bacillota bacterium]
MLQSAYNEAVDWIHSLGRFGMKPGLERIQALLERLGNPQRSLRYLHIGGSNGKGSTAAMAASVLQESGYRVGLYTSPYLIAFSNRMSINGEDIPPGELVELVDRVRPLVEELEREPGPGALSQFEVV